MTNESAASFLERIALLLELKGENPFKVRSYRTAAERLRALEEEAADLQARGELRRVEGIGRGIAENLSAFFERGSSDLLEALEAEVPEGLVDLTAIQGLGPKRVHLLHEKLGIASPGELEYACLENRLKDLKGFGEKSQARILEAVQAFKRYAGLFHIHEAHALLEPLARELASLPGVTRAVLSGAARRFLEVVPGGVLVFSAERPAEVLDRLADGAFPGAVLRREEDRIEGRHEGGMPLAFYGVTPGAFPCRLFHTTGSATHLAQVQAFAAERGYRLAPEGLFGEEGGRPLPLADEAALYRTLGLSFVPPELREGVGEVADAAQGRLPDLVRAEDILGVVHVHTTWSDGRNTVKEMAEAARSAGYAYLGISDHSRSAAYAGGLSAEALLRQGKEIRKLDEKMEGIRLLHGVESDILKDGSLDYPEEVLEQLDFVVASVHSGFRMDREAMTDRILRAVRNRWTRILGHPTGRLLLGREPYAVDVERVLAACAEAGVMVELNASPLRLDLDWRHLGRCRQLGVTVMIGPDAHGVGGLGDMRFGLGAARKGGLTPADVGNCLEVETLRERWRR